MQNKTFLKKMLKLMNVYFMCNKMHFFGKDHFIVVNASIFSSFFIKHEEMCNWSIYV